MYLKPDANSSALSPIIDMSGKDSNYSNELSAHFVSIQWKDSSY